MQARVSWREAAGELHVVFFLLSFCMVWLGLGHTSLV